MIPRHDDGSVTLVEQFRYPVGERCLEFPQGADEHQPDLDPLELARQELAEETGLRAASVQLARSAAPRLRLQRPGHVGSCSRPGSPQGPVGARGRGAGHDAASESPVAEVAEMMLDGRIRDCASVAAYGMLRLREARRSELLSAVARCAFVRGCSRDLRRRGGITSQVTSAKNLPSVAFASTCACGSLRCVINGGPLGEHRRHRQAGARHLGGEEARPVRHDDRPQERRQRHERDGRIRRRGGAPDQGGARRRGHHPDDGPGEGRRGDPQGAVHGRRQGRAPHRRVAARLRRDPDLRGARRPSSRRSTPTSSSPPPRPPTPAAASWAPCSPSSSASRS